MGAECDSYTYETGKDFSQIVPRVLIIDDNPDIHDDFNTILVKEEVSAFIDNLEEELFGDSTPVNVQTDLYDIDHAMQGQEGLDKIRKAINLGRPFMIAFVDMRMPPGWDGLETIERIWSEDPEIQIVICTAYSDYSWERITQRLGKSDKLLLLKKPFDVAEIAQLTSTLVLKWISQHETAMKMFGLEGLVEERTSELEKTNEGLIKEIDQRQKAEQRVQDQYHALELYTNELEMSNEELCRTQSKLLETNTQLQITLNDLKDSQEQLLQSAKLAAIGQLVSGIAHEVNNPLGAILLNAELLEDEVNNDGNGREYLSIISRQTERASIIMQNLLSFSRKHEPRRTPVSINDWIEQTLSLRSYEMALENIEVVREFAADLPQTMADSNQLQQVFLNLITNAEQSITDFGRKGTLVIRTQRAGDSIRIEFCDDGAGIPSRNRDRIFEPFFTTKPIGRGTGLGLSICYGIIQEHGGQIAVESQEGEGTAFTVTLPIVSGDGDL